MTDMPFTTKLDAGKSPEQLCAERAKRLDDALNMRQPDRIPVSMGAGYFLSEYGGVTHQVQQDDAAKAQELLEKAALDFQPDSIFGLFNNPLTSVFLGDRMTRWPGYDLPETGSFQFDEHEFMKGEDYDAFLTDPSDWTVRTYLPRAFKQFEGFQYLPPLSLFAFGHYSLGYLPLLTTPLTLPAIQALGKAIQISAEVTARAGATAARMAELGFPPSFLTQGAIIEAPFDFMSDTLRGMRGIMLDMHRRPEQLLAAERYVLDMQVKFAITFAKATGLPNCFIPLHRGSDGFMSLKQFEKFYWPQLKEMMLRLVENGIRPIPFYEGVWHERLDYLKELPKGKTAGMFQNSDPFKVKEALGDTMCIIGGMRNSLLQTGTPAEVRARTKKLCEVMGEGGGFIMSTEIGEMEGCKPENVRAWIDATREFGVY